MLRHARFCPSITRRPSRRFIVCIQTHGGFGFASEYDVERKFRESRLYLVAPISTNLILSYLAEHVLGLPRSF
jgi:acyl-CoA dehydrogenase